MDQKYAYRPYRVEKVVRSGILPHELAPLQVGPVCHSRWLKSSCVRTVLVIDLQGKFKVKARDTG